MRTEARLKISQFNIKIHELIARIETAHESGEFNEKSKQLQTALDRLAKQYQLDKNIGKTRHKLYSTQALIYYLQSEYAKGAEFTEEAERINEGSIGLPTQVTISQNDPPKGIGGWLYLYSIRLLLIPIVAIVGFTQINSLPAELLTKKKVLPNDIATFIDVGKLAVLLVLAVALVTAYFYVKKKKKTIIAVLTFEACFALANLGLTIWSSFLYRSYDVSSSLSNYIQGCTATIISISWLIYWSESKRVNATFVIK